MSVPLNQEPPEPERVLRLNYSGRIIDHLGIQMYQSPVAAIAELVANAWDADADSVEITLPEELSGPPPDGAQFLMCNENSEGACGDG